MDFLEVVKKRKSIRRFKDKQVEEEKIRKILEVVRQAPSAGNLQPYKVFVVKNLKKRQAIASAGYNQEALAQAPIIFVFCIAPWISGQYYGRRGEELYAVEDGSIACAYAQLAATNLGLSSCWIATFNNRAIRDILSAELIPIALLPIGYPAEDPLRPDKKEVEKIAEII